MKKWGVGTLILSGLVCLDSSADRKPVSVPSSLPVHGRLIAPTLPDRQSTQGARNRTTVHHRATAVDERTRRVTLKNSRTSEYRLISVHDFGDYENRVRRSLVHGRGIRVTEISYDEVESFLDSRLSSAYGLSVGDRLDFVAKQGLGGGKMDFLLGLPEWVLYDGKLYDKADFGNFLWGAGMARLDFSDFAIRAGSQMNAVFNAGKQNATNVKFAIFDSDADQRAIFEGAHGVHGQVMTSRRPGNCVSCLGQRAKENVEMLRAIGRNIREVVFGSGWKFD